MAPKDLLKKAVHEFPWIHLSIGLVGNLAFFVGSIFFLEALKSYKTLGVWLFIVGSFLMFLGSLGAALRKLWKHEEAEDRDRERPHSREATSPSSPSGSTPRYESEASTNRRTTGPATSLP